MTRKRYYDPGSNPQPRKPPESAVDVDWMGRNLRSPSRQQRRAVEREEWVRVHLSMQRSLKPKALATRRRAKTARAAAKRTAQRDRRTR